MISLFDAHVLVALFDPSHVHHDLSHAWFGQNRALGWATCPVTENGFVRVVSNPVYPGRRSTVADALERLQMFTESGDHHFWADSTSLRRSSGVNANLLEGHEAVLSAYLLLLTVQYGGRLVTFDDGVPVDAIRRAGPEQVVVLGK